MHKKFEEIIHQIMQDKDAGPFLQPVDYIGLQLLDYPLKIKNKMDLGTIQQNIKKYQNYEQLFQDIQLIWNNCKEYNIEGSQIFKQAEKLEKLTNKIKKNVHIQIQNKKKLKEKQKKNIMINKIRQNTQNNQTQSGLQSTLNTNLTIRGDMIITGSPIGGQNTGQLGQNLGGTIAENKILKKNEPADISQKLRLGFLFKNCDEDKLIEAINIIAEQWPYALSVNGETDDVKINISILDYPTATMLENLFNERNANM